MCLCRCAEFAREEDETRSEVLKSDDEKSSPRGDCSTASSARAAGKFGKGANLLTNTLERQITSTGRVQHKQTVRGCPPFKSFASLRRCGLRIISIPTQSSTLLFILLSTLFTASRPQSSLHKQPRHTSSPLQTRTPSLPGETSPAQGEDVRLQARYVSPEYIIITVKSMEAIGSISDELATREQKKLDEGHVSTRMY